MRSCRKTHKEKIKWEESWTNELSEKSCHTFPVTTEWINNLWKCSHANCSQVLCVSVFFFFCSIIIIIFFFFASATCYHTAFARSASIILQPWRYEKQGAIFSFKWVETHTASPAQTHSRWAELHVMSFTLKTALKHVLQPLAVQVSQGKQSDFTFKHN